MLVRPSMLDDLGLEPALHWQAKEFSRRCGIPVSVNIEGKLDNLPEALRLCLYRAIQEAMTNCGKHADASQVTVVVKQDETRVTASVQDDGRGFDAFLQTPGLGLMGMTERVRALHGRMSVASEPGRGTSSASNCRPGSIPARPDGRAVPSCVFSCHLTAMVSPRDLFRPPSAYRRSREQFAPPTRRTR